MISSIFFEKSCDLSKPYLYDEIVVDYLIAKFIREKKPFSQVKAFLNDFYGNTHSFSYVAFDKKYNEKTFEDPKYEQAFEKLEVFKEQFFLNEWESNESLLAKIGDYLHQQSFDATKLLPYTLAYDRKVNRKNDIYYEASFFNLVANENDIYREVDKVINDIKDTYSEALIKEIFTDKYLCDISLTNGLNSVKDLKTLSITALMTVFAANYYEYINIVSNLAYDYEDQFSERVNDVYAVLNTSQINCLELREGFDELGKRTLEEIGQKYGLTRERVRQIVAKADKLLLENAYTVRYQIISLFFHLADKEARYVPTSVLKDYLKENALYQRVLYLIKIGNFIIKYDEEMQLLYNEDIATPEEFANEIIDAFGDIIDKDAINCLDSFEKLVIQKYYRLYKNSFYLRKGVNGYDVIALVIGDVFPDGYKVDSEKTYQILKEELIKRFGEDFEIPTRRAIDTRMAAREDYCLAGRGIYKKKSSCATIPEELMTLIINFIYSHYAMVFYKSILERFKVELNSLGIDNAYYLKGLIDPELPAIFHTKRDYIQTSQERISSLEAVRQFMKSFDGKFSLDDLRNNFKGVDDAYFANIVYGEIDNGLISLSNHNFIYESKLQINSKAIEALKQAIDDLFVFLKEDTITSRKLYARIYLTNRNLLDEFKVVDNQFDLFSLIKCLFKNDYGFNRPLISKDKNLQTKSLNIIYNYVKKLDSFNSKTINNYTSKMNLRGLYSYLSFMEDMSEDYVQINIDTMISKKTLSLDSDNLLEIKNILNLVIDRYGQLDTTSFNGYALLPKIKYHWNKYLLIGIVRSYLSDSYEINNTDTAYDKTDFVIRRIN